MPSTPLTPLAMLALGLLVERPMHAYEMFQLMKKRHHDRLVKIRAGSLYHSVDRLVAHGLAVAVGTDREGNRPERTTYEITDAGRTTLRDYLIAKLAEPAEEYPEFTLVISEAHNLPAAQVVELLSTRLIDLRGELDYQERGIQKLRDRPLPKQYWVDLDYQHVMLSAEIAWIERLIAELDAGDLEWNTNSDNSHHEMKDLYE